MATTDTDALEERIARELFYTESPEERHRDGLLSAYSEDRYLYRDLAAAVLPIVAEEVRKAKAEAFDSFCNALADHLDLGTPRAWGFRHPCDPPGVRWEPTERDRALMDVADLVRNDTLNPYRETGDSDERR